MLMCEDGLHVKEGATSVRVWKGWAVELDVASAMVLYKSSNRRDICHSTHVWFHKQSVVV